MSLTQFKTILYASDLHDEMRPVFRHALSLAQHYDAKIIMCHVVKPLGATAQAVLDTYMPKKAAKFGKDDMKKIIKLMKERVTKVYLEELGDKKSKLVSEVVVEYGHPAEEICLTAAKHNVDLIVVGAHNNKGFSGRLLGSTARSVTHMADRPVLVVPILKPGFK